MKRITLKLIFSLTLLISSSQIYAQSFKTQFDELVAQKDTVGQLSLLEKWQAADDNDPDLYISYYNYYIRRSKKEIITIGTQQPNKQVESLTLTDSLGNEAGYMYSEITYDDQLISKAFEYIDEGIKRHPKRLDMRFGKIYLLQQVGEYDRFTDEIIATINYSNQISNLWLWANNTPLEDGAVFMLGSIQDYQVMLFDTEDDNLLDNMRRIAETVLKYFPEHIESLSNIAVTYSVKGEHDEAIKYLLRAEEINPEDKIVMANIANTYMHLNDIPNAIKYFEKMSIYADDHTKKELENHIKNLKESIE